MDAVTCIRGNPEGSLSLEMKNEQEALSGLQRFGIIRIIARYSCRERQGRLRQFPIAALQLAETGNAMRAGMRGVYRQAFFRKGKCFLEQAHRYAAKCER